MTDVLALFDHRFQPLASGGLWWIDRRTLIVADLHLEKASHFAARGTPLPPYDTLATLDAIAHDIEALDAAAVICLGDSFHDVRAFDRLDAEARLRLRRLTRAVEWTWITGNHDPDVHPDLGGRSVAAASVAGLWLRHEADPASEGPELSGHFHPKVWISARGRTIGRRCFAVSSRRIILPAYGVFTGGLDIGDPAIRAVMGRNYDAVLVADNRLLRYPAGAVERYTGAELA